MSFHSGERLKIAKESKSLTWQEIANAVNRTDSAVKKWVKDGIKGSSLPAIANYFNVNEWVFRDESLGEEEFKKIIFDPSLQREFRPSQDSSQSSKIKFNKFSEIDVKKLSELGMIKFLSKDLEKLKELGFNSLSEVDFDTLSELGMIKFSPKDLEKLKELGIDFFLK
jgi:transcriptional regulator with XRE-family HTH domain